MELYKFETDQIGITDSGVHLLRSRFNYDTLDFATVTKISIEKGRQVNNWLFLLVFGLVLFSFGIFWGIKIIYEYFFADNIRLFYIEQFVLPVLPVCVGSLSIYICLKTGPVMIVTRKNKVKRFPLGTLSKNLQVDGLVSFLKENELTRNKLTISLPGYASRLATN